MEPSRPIYSLHETDALRVCFLDPVTNKEVWVATEEEAQRQLKAKIKITEEKERERMKRRSGSKR